jgi:hypothetical protein
MADTPVSTPPVDEPWARHDQPLRVLAQLLEAAELATLLIRITPAGHIGYPDDLQRIFTSIYDRIHPQRDPLGSRACEYLSGRGRLTPEREATVRTAEDVLCALVNPLAWFAHHMEWQKPVSIDNELELPDEIRDVAYWSAALAKLKPVHDLAQRAAELWNELLVLLAAIDEPAPLAIRQRRHYLLRDGLSVECLLGLVQSTQPGVAARTARIGSNTGAPRTADTRVPSAAAANPEIDWDAYAVGLLDKHSDTILSMDDLHERLKGDGYPHGRSAVYKLYRVVAVAAERGIYKPRRGAADCCLPRGHKTRGGEIEAEDYRAAEGG